MKTKIIPFDLVTAKKIQAGEIEGAIKTRIGNPIRLLCTDLKNRPCIVAAETQEDGTERVWVFFVTGNYSLNSEPCNHDLVLEVPDNESQLKPFDKVLVRDSNNAVWRANFFSHKCGNNYFCVNAVWNICIPFEGNENLVGTTNKPKEDYR